LDINPESHEFGSAELQCSFSFEPKNRRSANLRFLGALPNALIFLAVAKKTNATKRERPVI